MIAIIRDTVTLLVTLTVTLNALILKARDTVTLLLAYTCVCARAHTCTRIFTVTCVTYVTD